MTIKRILAFVSICSLFLTVGLAQEIDQPVDTTDFSAGQIQLFLEMLADTVNGELAIPNVFTPNGDQVNDYFQVTTDGTTVYEFTIFTRTGTRIYHSLSPRIFWDGKSIGGKELPGGVYYYVIEEEGGSDPVRSAGFLHLYR